MVLFTPFTLPIFFDQVLTTAAGSGAVVGSIAGPIGAAVGAGVGAVAGGVSLLIVSILNEYVNKI